MIILTRLGGQALALNPDLIERAESTPDTVLTMVDGHKLVIAESLEEVVELVRTWRATVAAQAYTLAHEPDLSEYAMPGRGRTLDPVPGSDHPAVRNPDHPGARTPEDDLSAHTAIQASMARVLRLTPRGE